MNTIQTELLSPKQQAFLRALSITGSISQSAAAAHVNRNRHRGWIEENPTFAQAYEEAFETWADSLEAEAVRRATEGTRDPIVQNGKHVVDADGKPMFRNNRSDYLLGILLKAHRPEKYNPPGKLKTENKTIVANAASSGDIYRNLTPQEKMAKMIEVIKRLKRVGCLPGIEIVSSSPETNS